MDLPALIEECNLGAPPTVVMAIIEAESSRRPLALGVNSPGDKPTPPVPDFSNVGEAAAYAVSVVTGGYTVDVGLMQVNSDNLARFNVPLIQAFEPCKNIELGTRVYLEAAQVVSNHKEFIPGSRAQLQAILSVYNTGNPWAGTVNGYANRVLNAMSYGQDIAGAEMSVSFLFEEENNTKDGISVPFDVDSDWAITAKVQEPIAGSAPQEQKKDLSSPDH